MASNQVGAISALWRYPVKSMMGEELRSATIVEKGILGDRSFALVDVETGKVVSAKNPRRWPTMFSFHSRFDRMPGSGNGNVVVRITLPDGTMAKSDDSNLDNVLSNALGRQVRLVSQAPQDPQLEEYWPDMEELDNRDIVTDENMPAGTFFDLATVHILTTSTLDELSRHQPQGRFEPRRFRPNIIVTTEETGFAENAWIGKTLSFGNDVTMKITGPCPRCVMTTLPQSDLPRDPTILRTAAQNNNAHVGVYAEVVTGGSVKCDDVITVIA